MEAFFSSIDLSMDFTSNAPHLPHPDSQAELVNDRYTSHPK